MAYISVEELAVRLPNDGEGLDEDELQVFIDDAIARAEQENAVETPYSRAGVARMALADALEVIVIRDATLEAPIVDRLRNQAEKYFEMHDKAGAAATEPEYTPAKDAVVNPFDSLWRFSPGYNPTLSNPSEYRYNTWYG